MLTGSTITLIEGKAALAATGPEKTNTSRIDGNNISLARFEADRMHCMA